jgi:UDP-3-O-[3-hydroxymyristoyl] glucosamine N-acyltransferase
MKLTEIAKILGGAVEGDGSVDISGAAPVDEAGPAHISVLMSRKYQRPAAASNAAAIITSTGFSEFLKGRNLIIVDNPQEAFSRVLAIFAPVEGFIRGISEGSHIAASARLGRDVTVMRGAFVDERAEIGDRTIIWPNVFIGEETRVGSGCVIHPNATIRHRCVIGNNCVIQPGAVIGTDGFGFTSGAGGHVKVPQTGRVVIGDDVEIGANTTVDRGTTGDTIIGKGVKLDNLIMIGHNVKVGDYTVMAAQTGVSGSTRIGSWTMVGGQVGFSGHLTIGNGVRIAAQSGVISDLDDGVTVGGYPAVEKTRWLRGIALLNRLDKVLRELKAVEKKPV